MKCQVCKQDIWQEFLTSDALWIEGAPVIACPPCREELVYAIETEQVEGTV